MYLGHLRRNFIELRIIIHFAIIVIKEDDFLFCLVDSLQFILNNQLSLAGTKKMFFIGNGIQKKKK